MKFARQLGVFLLYLMLSAVAGAVAVWLRLRYVPRDAAEWVRELWNFAGETDDRWAGGEGPDNQ
jgi:hypothetical protein